MRKIYSLSFPVATLTAVYGMIARGGGKVIHITIYRACNSFPQFDVVVLCRRRQQRKMKVFGVVVVINAKRFIEHCAREEELRELLEGVSRSPSPCTARPHNRARQTTTSKYKQSIKTEK